MIDNAWQAPVDAPLSTFSVDVDTASYSNLRRTVLSGEPVQQDAVRLEEMVNYFDYSYPQPTSDHPFAVHVGNASCPWNPDHQLVRVALKGREMARTGVFLTVLGFGTGNLNDGMLEAITNKGNGTYHYIDTQREARRVFLRKLMGTLVTIAKDVKIQVEFNPSQVKRYRLLGYANRMLRKEDFANDKIDAGDIGSGHTVTAFYEVVTENGRETPPAGQLRYQRPEAHEANRIAPASDGNPEWLLVKLRYKRPDGDRSIPMEHPFIGIPRGLDETDPDFRFATSVAMTGLLLRGTEGTEDCSFQEAERLASGALGADPHGQRGEFLEFVRRLGSRR